MKVYMDTPERKPVIITLESDREIELFNVLICYDPSDDFAAHCLAYDESPEDVIRFWVKLEHLVARMIE